MSLFTPKKFTKRMRTRDRATIRFLRLSPEQALRLILDKRFELGDNQGRLLVRKEAVCQYPHLVWRPCCESLSPYYPFYMFTVGHHRLYVRIDGAVFTSLTLDIKGI